jgi:hypothetical protein
MAMKFARVMFLVAGLDGLVMLVPTYFLETRIGVDNPPPITHPEYFHGFIGIALAWQFMFLIIWRDPVRYRLAIVPATLEKLVFGGGAVVLFLQNRIALQVIYVRLRSLKPSGAPICHHKTRE